MEIAVHLLERDPQPAARWGGGEVLLLRLDLSRAEQGWLSWAT